MFETAEEDIALQDGALQAWNLMQLGTVLARVLRTYEDDEQILLSCSMIEKRTKKMIPSEARSDITYLVSVIRRLIGGH